MVSLDSWSQMFWWLLKPRFYSKCLSYVKFMKTRLEIIQKRKKAIQKFIKGDIAELLRNDFDYEAYKRAEGFLSEQNMLSCYELIEKFVGCISDHVEDLTKNKDCPDECKEAVPSLMYAAARFGDLPALRELRTLFTEKFGNSLEPFINQEFVEKLRQDPPTREMKIRLLNDIAQEFSIDWDAKALKQILYEERPNPEGDCNESKGKERDTPPLERNDFNDDDSWIHQSSTDDETSTSHKGSSSSSLGSISEDEEETKRPVPYWLIPPPYLKRKTEKGESNSKKTTDSEPLQKKESNRHRRSVRKDIVSDSKTKNAATLDTAGVKSGKEYDPEQKRRHTTSHVRGKSLPSEQATAAETSSKGHARAVSLESGGAWRVHPNLPDYDEVRARLAALRQRQEM